jgi:signal transduction histidine kinase
VATFVIYGVFWIAVLHFALVFPRPLAQLTGRPWLIVGLYAIPLIAFPAAAVMMFPNSDSILDWVHSWTSIQLVAAGAVSLAAFALVAITYFWRSDDTDRRRLRWVALAAGIAAVATLLVWIAPELLFGSPFLPWSAVGIAGLGFPVAIGIAILRHQLFDIDVIISRSLLYGGLTVAVAAIYGASVAVLGGVMQEGGDFAIPLLATGIGAFAMIPLYRWLSGVIGHAWPASIPAAASAATARVSGGQSDAPREALPPRELTETPDTRRRRATSLILSRTVVYGGLTAVVLVVYGISVAGLGSLLGGAGVFGISLLATGLAAIVALPLRDELQGAVNRRLYGDRDSPYRAIARLGERLEQSVPTQAVLPTTVETVAAALRLPYVAIELEQEGEPIVAAATGTPRGKLVRVPIVYRAQRIGDLVLAPRSPADPFSSADRRLLTDLARQAGAAAESVRLTAELQRSRERLVAAREEERRRLRRELHDGLGPALAGALLKLSTARKRLAADPAATGQLLNDVEQETRSAIDEVRRLARDLRPPALDELGLLSAVREQARYFSSDGLEVAVAAPDSLPALAAAVEVATYRIALEALTNVARHSGARHCRVEIALADASLELNVTDDGAGIGPDVQGGVGMASMHERAAELGGTLDVSPVPTGGTRVRAVLPLGSEA